MLRLLTPEPRYPAFSFKVVSGILTHALLLTQQAFLPTLWSFQYQLTFNFHKTCKHANQTESRHCLPFSTALRLQTFFLTLLPFLKSTDPVIQFCIQFHQDSWVPSLDPVVSQVLHALSLRSAVRRCRVLWWILYLPFLPFVITSCLSCYSCPYMVVIFITAHSCWSQLGTLGSCHSVLVSCSNLQ